MQNSGEVLRWGPLQKGERDLDVIVSQRRAALTIFELEVGRRGDLGGADVVDLEAPRLWHAQAQAKTRQVVDGLCGGLAGRWQRAHGHSVVSNLRAVLAQRVQRAQESEVLRHELQLAHRRIDRPQLVAVAGVRVDKYSPPVASPAYTIGLSKVASYLTLTPELT